MSFMSFIRAWDEDMVVRALRPCIEAAPLPRPSLE
jgi:hypothetical protein